MGAIATSQNIDLDAGQTNRHAFALDPQGRPRFIYAKEALGYDPRYAYCNAADCTVPANWSETLLGKDATFGAPSLTFTGSGQPRLATTISAQGAPAVYYMACDSACEKPANWTATPIADSQGTEFVLRLDSQNRPRLAIYRAQSASAPGGTLFFVVCNGQCANRANWVGTDVGLSAHLGVMGVWPSSPNADLALDAQGRPRIAFRQNSPDGLGYAWCDDRCEQSSAGWRSQTIEDSNRLDAELARPIPAGCSFGAWYGGYLASLALDPAGNPRIVQEALHVHGNGCQTGEDFRAVRFALLPAP